MGRCKTSLGTLKKPGSLGRRIGVKSKIPSSEHREFEPRAEGVHGDTEQATG